MAAKVDLLIASLQQAVKALQTYMVASLGGSLFFTLLTFSETKQITLQASGAGVPVSIEAAIALALSVYWTAGAMATFLVDRANLLISELRREAPELVDALLLYPSVATFHVYGPRQFLALAPAVLVVVGAIQRWGSGLLAFAPVVGLAFLLAPSVTLVVQLRTAVGGDRPLAPAADSATSRT